MSIDSISVDLDSTFSLGEWLESDDARARQRELEEKITNILFSHDPSSPAFLNMAIQLARIGCHPAKQLSLEHEIYALTFPDGYSVRPCGVLKKIGEFGSAVGSAVGDATKAVGNFVVDHATEIAVGIAIAGIAVVTGLYPFHLNRTHKQTDLKPQISTQTTGLILNLILTPSFESKFESFKFGLLGHD